MTQETDKQWRWASMRSAGAGLLLALLLAPRIPAQQPAAKTADSIAAVQQSFLTPPDDARIMMRWWWFGPAVTKPELEREILAMKAGGIGGFEIQPVYPMALDIAGDDTSKDLRNLPYLSADFLDAVSFAAKTARANGMRVDMTLNSGWPYGGPHVSIDQAAAKLRVVAVDLPASAAGLPLPAIGNGESLIATFAGDGSTAKYDADKLQSISTQPSDGRIAITPLATPRVVVFYIASRTGQQVKRAAVGAEGFVLDHYSRVAVDNHLQTVGEPLMKAFGDDPPYAVFSDSLEVYGADWTADLLPEFQRRRGYDLTPHLPQLASGTGEVSAEIRHDWGLTLTELFNERYLTPINDWANAHHTRFRSQSYGMPPASLSSNNLVALPEGEGPQWKSFSFTRLATSASHLYNRPITSSETFTWLHSPAFRATPLDMKAEADCFFLEGINQIIGHGWPYTPPGVAEPGWSFYAAAVFNDHNPWWIVMPDVTKYLQRMSYILRQGKPANDIAVLLPNDDAYADFKPGKDSLSGVMSQYVTDTLTQQIESSGHNLDYIDADAIHTVGIHYPILVLPHVERLSPETMQAIADYVAHGGKIIAIGTLPNRAPGFANAQQLTAQVQNISQQFASNKNVRVVGGDNDLGAALRDALPADVQLSNGSNDIGFIHRKLPDSDIYFLANTSNQPIKTTAAFRTARKEASSWDPFSGKTQSLTGSPIVLQLAPYESRVIVFTDQSLTPAKPTAGTTTILADWTHGWSVTYASRGTSPTSPKQIDAPASWTSDPDTQYFSGVATYSKTVTLTTAQLTGARSLALDFGEGRPVAPNPQDNHGTRALLDAPVRDAAVVIVNGKRMGSVWHPPYTLDLTGALHAGNNTIEIQVANTAINSLAGRTPTDYKLLTLRYTERFTPQDINLIALLPSGILGTVRLLKTK